MWCTRWFLPLLLLPIPTAPPYFLVLFLCSLTMHAKPCFYCIVLLATLFISSCYWQPFPLDSPLAVPWADNITTFAEALNSTLTVNYTRPFPSVIRAADRCWCDFAADDLFEPFNISRWERLSVEQMREELEYQQALDNARAEASRVHDPTKISQHTDTHDMPRTATPTPTPPTDQHGSSFNDFWAFLRSLRQTASLAAPTPQPTDSEHDNTPKSPPKRLDNLPLIRREYDLRPYGIGVTVDFGWTHHSLRPS
ncbi:hypothetical protein BDN72DRAFT_884395 [Pluteus cervinus]|uniref:Uncharacterized protein n=1 Tax=Pluteus cervinus TaxID=181527 RepID=A0ACD3BI25_9AGAR|nr:hypothetical protein BDN72DRAFT_884395 [Pluteus cervinus]